MTYKETLDWMFRQLPMFQRQGKTAFKKDLSNSIAFSNHLDHPEQKFKSVHVAGTNGKGSTSHMIASILQEVGLRVGLYTSPHLKDFRERIKINGQPISKPEVVDFIAENKEFLNRFKPSFFEMTVAMAFDHFGKKSVDIAVIEVGLGGRLDSTNIVTPELSVITNIGYDHTQFLGETLKEIAFEKAGIIKKGIPVVIGEYQEEVLEVFQVKAEQCAAPLSIAEREVSQEYKTDLKGDYQKHNVKTAVQAIYVLRNLGFNIGEDKLKRGLQNVVSNTELLGRYQTVNEIPRAICDTGHNKEGLVEVLDQLKNEQYVDLHIVLGLVEDKNLYEILPLFPEEATYYFCKPDIPRGIDVVKLENACNEFGLAGSRFSTVTEAYNRALQNAKKQDLIFVGGSTFVVAEVL